MKNFSNILFACKFISYYSQRNTILQCSLIIFKYVPLSDTLILEAIQLFRKYLSPTWSEEIQIKTIEIFAELILLNEDAVWYYMHELKNTSFVHTNFRHLSVTSSFNPKMFTKNCNIIINKIPTSI